MDVGGVVRDRRRSTMRPQKELIYRFFSGRTNYPRILIVLDACRLDYFRRYAHILGARPEDVLASAGSSRFPITYTFLTLIILWCRRGFHLPASSARRPPLPGVGA